MNGTPLNGTAVKGTGLNGTSGLNGTGLNGTAVAPVDDTDEAEGAEATLSLVPPLDEAEPVTEVEVAAEAETATPEDGPRRRGRGRRAEVAAASAPRVAYPLHLKQKQYGGTGRLRLVRRVVAVKAVASTTAVAIGITAAAAATGVVVSVVDPPRWGAEVKETSTSSTSPGATVTIDLDRPASGDEPGQESDVSPTKQLTCVLNFGCKDPLKVLGPQAANVPVLVERVEELAATTSTTSAGGAADLDAAPACRCRRTRLSCRRRRPRSRPSRRPPRRRPTRRRPVGRADDDLHRDDDHDGDPADDVGHDAGPGPQPLLRRGVLSREPGGSGRESRRSREIFCRTCNAGVRSRAVPVEAGGSTGLDGAGETHGRDAPPGGGGVRFCGRGVAPSGSGGRTGALLFRRFSPSSPSPGVARCPPAAGERIRPGSGATIRRRGDDAWGGASYRRTHAHRAPTQPGGEARSGTAGGP